MVAKLAWGQHAAFSAAQAVDRGVSRSWLSRHRAPGDLELRAPAVYVLADAPKTTRQDLMVHVLAAGEGTRATADSGLALWCPAHPRWPEIAVHRWCGYRARGVSIRRSSDLDLAVPGVVDGVPVVGVTRALLDASRDRTVDQVRA